MWCILNGKTKISEWRLRINSRIASNKDFVKTKSKPKERARLPVKCHKYGEIFQASQA